jgi:hypothetical protein
MVPVLLAPPPCAKTDAAQGSKAMTAQRRIRTLLMALSFCGVALARKGH